MFSAAVELYCRPRVLQLANLLGCKTPGNSGSPASTESHRARERTWLERNIESTSSHRPWKSICGVDFLKTSLPHFYQRTFSDRPGRQEYRTSPNGVLESLVSDLLGEPFLWRRLI